MDITNLFESGRIYVAGLAAVALGGCATANLQPGERLNKMQVSDSSTGKVRTYETTDKSDELLRVVMGIRKGTMSVSEDYNGNLRVSGRIPNQLGALPEYDAVYNEADVNKDGTVDTPEAESLYQKTVTETLK